MDMVRECMAGDRPFGVCLITKGREVGTPADHQAVGCTARIDDWDMTEPGVLQLRTVGVHRFSVLERSVQSDGLIRARVELMPDDPLLKVPGEQAECATLIRRVIDELVQSEPDPKRRVLAHRAAPRGDSADRPRCPAAAGARATPCPDERSRATRSLARVSRARAAAKAGLTDGRRFAQCRWMPPGTRSSRAAIAHRAVRRDPSDPACSARCRAPATRAGRWSTVPGQQNTRFTLPSRIAARSPQANAAIAAAVDSPMPGSSASAAAEPGKRPPCRSTTICAQR